MKQSMDRIDAMAAFVAVADLEGFAPAARKLGLSPSNVTRLIGRWRIASARGCCSGPRAR
jgi:hypothetical protein